MKTGRRSGLRGENVRGKKRARKGARNAKCASVDLNAEEIATEARLDELKRERPGSSRITDLEDTLAGIRRAKEGKLSKLIRRDMLADLKRSGLTLIDAERMGCVPLVSAEAKELGYGSEAGAGYLIPYHDPAGKRLSQKFHRFRRLGFINKDGGRYRQVANTMSRVYVPPVRGFEWNRVLRRDPRNPSVKRRLYLVEGEKKAYAMTKAGFPTLGIGGVWNFAAKGKAALLPDFPNWIDLAGLEIVIVFDSDRTTNPDVSAAAGVLSSRLIAVGAIPLLVDLPEFEPGEKSGADDVLVKRGVGALREILDAAKAVPEAADILALNEHYAYTHLPPGYFALDDRQLLSWAQFKDRTARLVRKVLGPRGGVTRFSPAEEWNESVFRREHRRIDYVPGGGEVISEGNVLNRWRSPFEPRKPKQWEVDLYQRLRDHVFRLAPELSPLFDQWAAYPHHFPGGKIFWAVLVVSIARGVGKTMLGELLAAAYGHNATTIGTKQLASSFNEFAIDKQFVNVEEIHSDDSKYRISIDELKVMIAGGRDIEINTKGVRQYRITDCINYYLSTNYPNALPVHDAERRFLVLHAAEGALDDAFYETVARWLRSGEAGPAMLGYFLGRVDCASFNPAARPPVTAAQQEMAESHDSSIKAWCRSVVGGDSVEGHELVTATELSQRYRSFITSSAYSSFDARWPVSIGIALRDLGVPCFHLKKHHFPKGVLDVDFKLHPIRNIDAYRELWGNGGARAEQLVYVRYQKQRGQKPFRKIEGSAEHGARSRRASGRKR